MSNVRVAKVPVDQVQFHTHNVRRDLGDLRPLAASIKRFGVMQPIVVEDYGDTMRLRAGHRRLAAARMNGLSRIPALVHDVALDDDEWLVHSAQENVMRRGLDDEERRRAIQALRDLGCTWQGIADAFGVQATTVQRWYVGKKRTTSSRARIYTSTLRTFTETWRQEAARRPVSVAELLDALDQVAKTSAIGDALPDELASRRRSA
jgi:ParB/RepB/Spo0J family partition protein